VSAIERCDVSNAKSFGGCDHRGVGRSEREIAIGRNEFSYSHPVTGRNRLRKEVARSEIAEKSHFRVRAETGPEEIRDLGDDQCRHDERSGVRLQQFKTGGMMTVITIDVGVEGPSVDDQSDD
jgi:hypothetical protein